MDEEQIEKIVSDVLKSIGERPISEFDGPIPSEEEVKEIIREEFNAIRIEKEQGNYIESKQRILKKYCT